MTKPTALTLWPTVDADVGWPRRDDNNNGPKRPRRGCRSGLIAGRPVERRHDAVYGREISSFARRLSLPPLHDLERRLAYGNSAVHLISASSPGIASAVTPSAVHAG